jgi:hypothetical protein
MAIQIALLGWGSLLWDERPEFDQHHEDWRLDGPDLKIEFSRISKTRGGALTLVVDAKNGTSCQVAYSRSKRCDAEEAIEDLRSREGTTRMNIGFHFSDGSGNKSKDQATLTAIKSWAAAKKFDAVVWTDLSSNFEKEKCHPFSVEAAMRHLSALDAATKADAAEYVRRAPDFVSTPVRVAIHMEPWFNK